MKPVYKAFHLLLCFSPVGASASGPPESPKPNILLIISDDQGYGEFGFTGNKLVETPHLDRLAENSAVYRQFVVAPACSPTRASLLTGRNHLSVGVWGVGPRGDIRRDEVLMPQFFKKAGHQNWLIGKHDSNTMMELGAAERGYDWWAIIGGGYLQKNPIIFSPGTSSTVQGWTADIMTDAVIEKIRGSGGAPWFAFVAYIIPHLPWQCPDTYAARYREKECSEQLSLCYGSITQMDHQIGRLLDAVREAGQEDNTIVVFLSDNGPTEGKPAWVNSSRQGTQVSGDWAKRNPLGLTGQKGEIWEHGIRSPLLISWPGRIAPGDRAQLAAVEDLLPTLLDLANISPELCPDHLPFDGINLRESLADGESQKQREIFRLAMAGPGEPGALAKNGIVEEISPKEYTKLHTTLRRQRYKFHHLPGGETKLFDIEADPGEKNDLGERHPEIVREMATRCRQEWDRIIASGRAFWSAQTRINNSKGSAKAWTVFANRPAKLRGEARALFDGGCTGFGSPEDAAEYHVELEEDGLFDIVVIGKNLDQCGSLQVLVNGTATTVSSRAAEKIELDPVQLRGGMQTISLKVDPAGHKASASCVVDSIVLAQVESDRPARGSGGVRKIRK